MKKYHPHGDAPIYDALVRMAQDFSLRAPADRPPGQLRLDRRRPARRHAVHRGPARPARDGDAPRHRQGDRRLHPELRRLRAGADRPAGALPEPAGQRLRRHRRRDGDEHPAAQPRRGDRRGDRARSTTPRSRLREPDEVRQGTGLPDGGRSSWAATASRRPTRPAAARSGCGPASTIEEGSPGPPAIVVTELPYMVNKARARREDRRARDARARSRTSPTSQDESSGRGGMRLVIELRRGANPHVVLNQLYKHTQLQDSFGVNMLALVDGVPRTLNLKRDAPALPRPPGRRRHAAHALRAAARPRSATTSSRAC